MKMYFYLSRKKLNRKGFCPIVCRVASLHKREDFRTGLFIEPEKWDKIKGFPIGNENNTGTRLSIIQNDIYRIITQCELDGIAEPIEVIGRYKTPVKNIPRTISELYSEYKKTTEITANVDTVITNAIRDFRLATNNMAIQKVGIDTINFFAQYLKTNFETYTTVKKLRSIKRIFAFAERNKFIGVNPFANFTMPRLPRLEPIQLTEKEIQTIAAKNFVSDRITYVRDLFLLQCFTGLSFSDLFRFNEDMVVKSGEAFFISGKRAKTDNSFYVPFCSEAKTIAEKYGYDFRNVSNQKFNEYLKEIAALSGIDKPISTHVGRKTFSQRMINKGFSAESVSKMMGHANFSMTQKHYGRISENRIETEFLRIAS